MAVQSDEVRSPTTGPEADGWEKRVRDAAMAAEAAKQVYDDTRLLRDRLVVEGFDAGRSVASVARAALMSQARVHQLVARNG